MPFRSSPGADEDPLAAALKPPPDETAEMKALRLRREEEARLVSKNIDEAIRLERVANKKKRIIRVLLLGQSESGKSTTLRQFQRLYTPTAFRDERIHWRSIIQLNLIRSIHTILSALRDAQHTHFLSMSPRSRAKTIDSGWDDTSTLYSGRHARKDSKGERGEREREGREMREQMHQLGQYPAPAMGMTGMGMEFEHGYGPSMGAGSGSGSVSPPRQRQRHGSNSPTWGSSPPNPSYIPHHSNAYASGSGSGTYPSSLMNYDSPHQHHNYNHSHTASQSTSASFSTPYHPFTHTHSIPLPSHPGDEDSEDLDALAARLLPLQHIESLLKAKLVPPNEEEAVDLGASYDATTSSQHQHQPAARSEIFVRPGRWRASFIRTVGGGRRGGRGGGSGGDGWEGDGEDEDEAQRVLWECRDDMISLWRSQRVRECLALKRVRLEDESGFFLNDLERVTEVGYLPTDDDVLKARLKTIGVSEYKFEMEAGPQTGTEWRIVDVGGSRFQRPTWVPFFDDVDAIIFLAPISAFDQVLTEDPKTNRLEDSVLLWKAVCSNKLLQNVDLVLFLNKCDLLERKLASGVRLARYVKSYGERGNDGETASKYFRSKFSAIQRAYSPTPRKFYGFCTSVTDTATTAGILASVRDIVLRQHLKQSKLV